MRSSSLTRDRTQGPLHLACRGLATGPPGKFPLHFSYSSMIAWAMVLPLRGEHLEEGTLSLDSPPSIPVPDSSALEQGEERYSRGQIYQERLPGGKGAAAGSKNDSGLVCPTAGLRALRTFRWKKKQRVCRKEGWMGEQAGREQSSEPWGCVTAAL